MPIEWVTAPPEPALELVEAGVRERAGAVLIGPAGVGKTTLARTAAARLGSQFGRVDWVTGTAPMAAVPFAAFSDVIDVPDAGKTAEVLRLARETLGDGRLLIVDDAHLLDKLSAALVYQLAVSGAAKVIVTVTANGPVAEEISALWKDDVLARIDLQPPGHDDSQAGHAGRGVRRGTALPPRIGCWNTWPSTTRCRSTTSSRWSGPRPSPRRRTSGAIVIDDDRLRPAHPLFVDAVRDALGGPELRRLRTELVDRFAAVPARSVVDDLRLAVLALDSDRPQPTADVIRAAEEALRLGDLVLSERLGRAAVQRGAGLPARLTLAYALAWQGRGRDADSVLAEVDPTELSEPELMAWALPRAANQFWMLSEPERATAFLQATRNRVSSPIGANHARRAIGDVRDERGQPRSRHADRRGGAGVAVGR